MTNAKKEQRVHNEQTVHLDNPIRHGEQTIKTITLREPVAGDLQGLKLTELASLEVDSLRKLLPRISTPPLTEADVVNLALADLFQLGGAFTHFLLPKSLQTNMDFPTE